MQTQEAYGRVPIFILGPVLDRREFINQFTVPKQYQTIGSLEVRPGRGQNPRSEIRGQGERQAGSQSGQAGGFGVRTGKGRNKQRLGKIGARGKTAG
jgi:hypothetical protein